MQNLDNVTHYTWCSFCSSREADAGHVTMSIYHQAEPADFPICTECLEKAREAGKLEE